MTMSTIDLEIQAMQEIGSALGRFEDEDQEITDRILRWANDRYGSNTLSDNSPVQQAPASVHQANEPRSNATFSDMAELVYAIDPRTDAERALAAGYWFQTIEDQREFTAQEVNARLKDLGHGVSNITDAMTSLMKRKPALVIQTAKKGSSKQARKRYRLTKEGIRECESRIPQS